MTLIEEIILQHALGTESEAIALRDLLPLSNMIADYDVMDSELPYVILIEGKTTQDMMAFSNKCRVETTPVEFHVFANSKAEVTDLVNALDDCYQCKILPGCAGYPQFISREPIKRTGDNLNNWRCVITFCWQVQKQWTTS